MSGLGMELPHGMPSWPATRDERPLPLRVSPACRRCSGSGTIAIEYGNTTVYLACDALWASPWAHYGVETWTG